MQNTHNYNCEECNKITGGQCPTCLEKTVGVKLDKSTTEELTFVGGPPKFHLCLKCGGKITSNEIEIMGNFYEFSGFCGDEKCERFLLLVV